MKKGFWGVIMAAIFMVFAVACSNQSKETTAKSDSQQEKTEYYQDLSKSDRESVNFNFKAVEDDSTSSSETKYVIDMIVKNNDTKDIKLSLSKIFMLNPYDRGAKVTSSQNKTITLKSGQKKTIKQIFENVSRDVVDGQGAYYYLNKNYRLAYFYGSTTEKGATSDNLSDSAARKSNKKTSESNNDQSINGDSDNNTDNSATTNNTNQQSSQQTNSSSNNIINTPSQSIGLFKHMYAMGVRDDIVADPVDDGFYVHTSDGVMAATIHYDGSVSYSDGTNDSYSDVSQPTNNGQVNSEQYDPSKH